MFFRERIGYIVANPLFKKHRRIPLRVIILWLMRLGIVLSIVGIIIGVGKYQTIEYTEPQKHNILIVLDISRSMLAEDVAPSRIESAKETIRVFIRDRDDDIFSLIVFAGKPIVSFPFSTDITGISHALGYISPNSIRQELP